jgi:acetyltransferase
MTNGSPARVFSAAAEVLTTPHGTGISLRPLSGDDRAAFAALFARLTPESRYRRFLSPKRELTTRELAFFTDTDHLNHEAVAAIDQRDNSIVGVSRYVRDADRPNAAELAIEVADAFQMMGIGTALARLTIERAQTTGLTLLTATTLWENHAARRLLRRLGFRARNSRGGEIEHELKLEELAPACVDEPAREAGSAVGIVRLDAPFSVATMHPHNVRYRGVRAEP